MARTESDRRLLNAGGVGVRAVWVVRVRRIEVVVLVVVVVLGRKQDVLNLVRGIRERSKRPSHSSRASVLAGMWVDSSLGLRRGIGERVHTAK